MKESINAAALRDDAGWRGHGALLPHARIRAQQVQFSAISTNITCPTCQMVTSTSLGFTHKKL